MAHVEHYKMPDVRRLVNEWTRDEAYTCKDGRIDTARTKHNYVMDDGFKHGFRPVRNDPFCAALRSRLSKVSHSNRKDLNVLSDWVVTCPEELKGDPDKMRKFFDITYKFTQERYGADNVLQGFVHMDETSPHVHIPVVPVKDGRISAKALFTRKELHSYHRDLEAVMCNEFGLKGLVLNGRTKGNYTVAELKERTKDERAMERRRRRVRKREVEVEAREKAVEARERALSLAEVEMRQKYEEAVRAALRRSEEAIKGYEADAAAKVDAMRDLSEAQRTAAKVDLVELRKRRLAGVRDPLLGYDAEKQQEY